MGGIAAFRHGSDSIELAFGFINSVFDFLVERLFFPAFQLQQNLPFFNPLPTVEMYFFYQFGHAYGNGHIFVGFGGAQGFQLIADFNELGGFGHHTQRGGRGVAVTVSDKADRKESKT